MARVISIQSCVRRGRLTLRRYLADPRVHILLWGIGYFSGGFFLSAAALGQQALPLAPALVASCGSWSAVLTAVGAAIGYRLFWGGGQPLAWTILCLCAAVALAERRISRENGLLLPSLTGLTVACCGVVYRSLGLETTSVALYLLRVMLGMGTTWVFVQVRKGRNPMLEWLCCALAQLALAQLALGPWFNLGFFGGGLLASVGAFPAAAVGGLALDLAQITPVPMTAVLVLAYLTRLLPGKVGMMGRFASAWVYFTVMWLCGKQDLRPLLPLLLGSLAGSFLPLPGRLPMRRGETGVAQVRLEMAAGVLFACQQLLLEAPELPVDETALVARAAERACGNCPNRNGCKDAKRIVLLPGLLLHKPLLQSEELPIVCRKSGRFLAELHRSQEQLRSIRADRERQREYRAAVLQQYCFLGEFLQGLSDQLARKCGIGAQYCACVSVFGNRPEEDNGDRCLRFPGTGGRYYVLLCDGMGTGMGAVQEGRTAGNILRRLLSAGFPACHALGSLNSLCALRERAGAVTVDLAEIALDSGRVELYKWGAVPSYLVGSNGVEKLGNASPPPGLSVTDCREEREKTRLRLGQMLVMVSDGISESDALRCCTATAGQPPAVVAMALLEEANRQGQDDATVVTVMLEAAEGT